MVPTTSLVVSLLLGLASAQTPGKLPEVHPKIETWKCTKKGGCVAQTSLIVLDDLQHPVQQKNNPSLDCGEWGNPPNVTVCPDAATCAKNCIVEGISNYTAYGITTQGSKLNMHMLVDGKDVTPRAYLLEENGLEYQMLSLTGNELSFDVEQSHMPCGMNGALYLAEMSKTGGRSALNPGGATYGTGYCDAQCYTLPFIEGVGNIAGKGTCCTEMDIWEANMYATALTPHTCNQTGLYECTGDECTWNGVCDQWGCSYNPYAVGNPGYYGPKDVVDSSKVMTVVTQFPTFPNGTLKAINRLYIQNGKVIQNAAINVTSTGLPAGNEIDAGYCATSASRYVPLGGMQGMGEALKRGMVLIFAIWWDSGGYMNWLDTGSTGPCNTTEGNPSVIVEVEPNPAVTFSNIKWGEIGSTYDC